MGVLQCGVIFLSQKEFTKLKLTVVVVFGRSSGEAAVEMRAKAASSKAETWPGSKFRPPSVPASVRLQLAAHIITGWLF